MTRLLRTLALCFGLALAALAIVSPAVADDGAAAAAKATNAAARLQTYSDRMRRAGRRPDFAAAPAAELLRVVFDADRFAALPRPTSQDFDWLMAWADAATRSYTQIISVGGVPGQRPDDAKLARNLGDYQDQITAGMSFLVRALAREIEVGTMFMSELPEEQVTPIRVDGYQGLRAAGVELLQSVLCVAQGIKSDNVRLLMTAIYDTREIWIATMTPAQRTVVSQQVREIMNRLSDKVVTDSATPVLAAFTDIKA